MKRRVWGFLWVVSLLLCVAAAVLWVRSYFKDDSIGRFVHITQGADGMDDERFLESNDGRLFFGHNWHQYHFNASDRSSSSDRRWRLRSVEVIPGRFGPAYFPLNIERPGYRSWMRGFDLGFLSIGHFFVRSEAGPDWEVSDNRAVNVAHWPVVMLLLIAPMIRVWQARRARRLQRVGARLGQDMGEAPMPR